MQVPRLPLGKRLTMNVWPRWNVLRLPRFPTNHSPPIQEFADTKYKSSHNTTKLLLAFSKPSELAQLCWASFSCVSRRHLDRSHCSLFQHPLLVVVGGVRQGLSQVVHQHRQLLLVVAIHHVDHSAVLQKARATVHCRETDCERAILMLLIRGCIQQMRILYPASRVYIEQPVSASLQANLPTET